MLSFRGAAHAALYVSCSSFSLVCTVTLASAASDPTQLTNLAHTRSGMVAQGQYAPFLAIGSAASACVDAVFANGLDDASHSKCHTAGTVQIFTDRAAFLGALSATHTVNAFDDIHAGTSGGLVYSEHGFEYQIYTQFHARGPLYNGDGFISTDRSTDQVILYQTGDPVTAIGGNFWASDFSLQPVIGTIDIYVNQELVDSFESTNPNDFRGFITESPISSLTIDSPDIDEPPPGTSTDRWPTMDNLIIGNGL